MNKKGLIITIIFVVIIIGLYFLNQKLIKEDYYESKGKIIKCPTEDGKEKMVSYEEFLNSAYIDMYEDLSFSVDIDLYSTGSGDKEQIYLGHQPTHYLIFKNGDIYTYTASSYAPSKSGINKYSVDPKIEKYGHFNEDNLKSFKNDLEDFISNNKSDDSNFFINGIRYYIKIDGNESRVDGNPVDLLDNYFRVLNGVDIHN